MQNNILNETQQFAAHMQWAQSNCHLSSFC